jgi:hypothetical protein
MTITIKRRTAVLFVAVSCILAGLAIGQLTQARSANSGYQLSQVVSELKKVNQTLGSGIGVLGNGINGKLYKIEGAVSNIEKSTSGTCRAVEGTFC